MSYVIRCSKVVPDSGCPHSIRGETEDELMRNAREHAKEHGIVQVTPELVERLKSFVERE
jgi:predicted small metal-binding protein